MKLLASSLFLAAAFMTQSLSAATIGDLSFAGTGCTNKDNQLKVISESDSRYMIPLNLYVKKEEGASLERQACTVSLPIVLAKNEKLVIQNVSQKVNMRVYPGVTAKTQLEVFLAGHSTKVITAQTKAIDSFINERHELAQQGTLIESQCGEQVIVRANTSGFALGKEKARIYHENLKLDLKIEKCSL
ncbi:MAG: DUF4360 domain-containing protein [Pseudobdellovibrio sp.]